MRKSDLFYIGFLLLILVLLVGYLFPLGGLTRVEHGIVKDLRSEGFGMRDLFAVIVLTAMVMGFILMLRFRAPKGNISQYDVTNLHPIWADVVKADGTLQPDSGKRQKRFLMLVLLSVLAMAIIVYVLGFFEYTDITDISLSIALIAMILSFFVLFVLFSVLLLKIARRLLREGEEFESRILHVYKEGLLFFNHFLEWGKIKNMEYPLAFHLAERIGVLPPEMSPAGPTTTLRIKDLKGKVYYVQVVDREGLGKALNKLGKAHLMK
ncbi:MAG: hypothetical protein V1835_05585 [Candidatus Micrarchaeota archaeon]